MRIPAPRGTLELVEAHGTALADAVDRGLKSAAPVAAALRTAYGTVDLPFAGDASREQWETPAGDRRIYMQRHAALMKTLVDRSGHLPEAQTDPVQVWRFGAASGGTDLTGFTLVALGGEVVVDYALRLAREYPGPADVGRRLQQRCLWLRALASRAARGWLRRRRRDDLLRPSRPVQR